MLEETKPEVVLLPNEPPLVTGLEASLATFFSSFESPLTGREYFLAAREFLGFVSGHITRPSELRRDHLIAYQSMLRDKGLARKTILKKISAVSSLCKHLAFEGFVKRDLAYGLKRPDDTNKRETADFSEEEVRKIFEGLDPKRMSYTSHKAILSVGFYTGLRSAEIRGLQVKNLTTLKGHRILSLEVKGKKPHEIALNPLCARAIDEHLEFIGDHFGADTSDPEQWIFPSLKPFRNKPLSAQGLNKVFADRLKDSGIEVSTARRYSPHSMRATFAGHLLNKAQVPLEQVQRAMGHSNPATTMAYNKREEDHDRSPVYKIEY